MSTFASDRNFACFPRGNRRDFMLAQFRIGLRRLVNPETGVLFTEDEIARATQVGSRWWIEADGLDIVLMAKQSRAIYLAQQMRPERANDSFLYGYHGDLWGQTSLPGIGGAGVVVAQATKGTVFVGSTTIPDPAAHTARDEATGMRFQVLETVTAGALADGSGIAFPTLIGIDIGEDSNLEIDTVLRWENPPLGSFPECKVITNFRGGRSQETSAEYARRLRDTIRHKAASGNRAHFREWAREDSRVLDAYIYPCAMRAGTVLVCITQRRGTALGPSALAATDALLTMARERLVPPGSDVVPERALVNVVRFTPQPTDVALRLGIARRSSAGWTDAVPWPGFVDSSATNATVAFTMSDTQFVLNCEKALSNSQPSLMAWDATKSRFDPLAVQSVVPTGPGLWMVTLLVPCAHVIRAGDAISPDSAMRDQIALSVQDYFDSLGPGEVVRLLGGVHSDRAARYPTPDDDAPYSTGPEISDYLHIPFGSALSQLAVQYNSLPAPVVTPSLPDMAVDGPRKLTLGKLRVFAF